MIQTHGDIYLAGLWKGDIHRGLLWRPKDPRKMTVYAEYTAPTWSWASLRGIIEWPFWAFKSLRNQLIVRDVELIASGEDSLGRLGAGQIMVLGKLKPLKAICLFNNTQFCYYLDENVFLSDNTLALLVCIDEAIYFSDWAYGILIEPALARENDVGKFCRVGSFHCVGEPFQTVEMKEVIIV
jgi:hypothetical protein